MSPRPRKASDEEILAAAHRVMERLGAAQWTLADVAGEAGVTAGALVQRFGSKRALLIALAAAAAAATGAMLAELRAAWASPLDAVRAYADCLAQMGTSPAAIAHHLGYLQRDLADPELRRHLRTQARVTRSALRDWLVEARAAGELAAGVDTAALARVVEVTLSGSLLTWAFYQEGAARAWMRRDLAAALAPYLPAPK